MRLPTTKSSIFCCAAAALLILSAGPAAADSEKVRTEESIQLALAVVNECHPDFELVQIDATIILETVTHHDSSGKLHVIETVTATGTGTGTVSGASYTLDDIDRQRTKMSDPLPFTFITHRTLQLVGDAVPDMHIKFSSKLMIREDGTVKHFDSTAETHCTSSN